MTLTDRGWLVDYLNVTERRETAPALAVSTVIFALRDNPRAGRKALWLPLVRRTREPFKGQWALPGGPLGARQSLHDAAATNLQATTGLTPSYLEQLYAFGGLDRSPARRTVSIVYWALVRDADSHPDSLLADENVDWFPAEDPAVLGDLAFDHAEIVRYALWRLRNKVEYGSIAYRLLGERFTLAQVREVYEAVLGRRLDPGNFRRHLRCSRDIEPTEEFLQGGKHRPPRLYRYTGDTGSPDTGSIRAAGPLDPVHHS